MAIIKVTNQDVVCDILLEAIKQRVESFTKQSNYDDLEQAETLSRIYQRIKSVETN